MENEDKWYFKKLPTRDYMILSGGFAVANVFPTMATGKGFDHDVNQIVRDHNSAPDMLEALQYLIQGRPGEEQFDRLYETRVNAARLAISKALGE